MSRISVKDAVKRYVYMHEGKCSQADTMSIMLSVLNAMFSDCIHMCSV